MPAEVESVFAGDSAYASFFTALFRHLHRSSPRHVLLLRERGVGEQAALVELARAGVSGQPQFLHSKQFLTIDCRHVPFEAVRETIGSIFSKIGPMDQVIACLDSPDQPPAGSRIHRPPLDPAIAPGASPLPDHRDPFAA